VTGGRFVDRVVFVSGSTGMAESAAPRLAAEGAHVFVASRSAAHASALAESIDGAWIEADLGVEAEVEAAVAACVERFGRVDALYHVAGISGRRFGDGVLHELTAEGWDTVMTANARSTFLVARGVVRHLMETARGGSLLLMSSVSAVHPAPEHFATHAYAASKGAIDAFVRATAAWYAPHGIRINAIAPGLVATPMSQRAQGDAAILGYLVDKQPLASGPIDADDVTSVALHLLSDEARMVTGQVVTVDGGWSVSEPRTR
jgi:NAD(P)-dependent dehydrogenase (short-subunit alcohol dehydrogenase family)